MAKISSRNPKHKIRLNYEGMLHCWETVEGWLNYVEIKLNIYLGFQNLLLPGTEQANSVTSVIA